MFICNNDIIIIKKDIYIPFPGGKWADHFAEKNVYLLVKSIKNNGSITAVNFKNKLVLTHKMNVIKVINR